MQEQLSALADELERDQGTLQRELDEIDILLKQATSEAERHETRRVQAEERAAQVERQTGSPEAVVEARTALLSQTRRATLMQSQLDVLSGKQRALQRYRERVAVTLPVIRAAAAAAEPASAASAGTPPPADTGDVLAAQEQMRREIARQMHDGPAQSIANIALQAQVVQRLVERDPSHAGPELTELVKMVQQALDATKSFIFDVRPMVLDDLGLVPTLRRSTAERARRSRVPIRFESIGTDRRLPTDIESGMFRMVDDAVVGMMGARPLDVLVRLDWSDEALRVTVMGRPHGAEQTAQAKAQATVAAARRDKNLPAALAHMIHQQQADDAHRRNGPSDAIRADITQRAAPLGLHVRFSEDRWRAEISSAPFD